MVVLMECKLLKETSDVLWSVAEYDAVKGYNCHDRSEKWCNRV